MGIAVYIVIVCTPLVNDFPARSIVVNLEASEISNETGGEQLAYAKSTR